MISLNWIKFGAVAAGIVVAVWAFNSFVDAQRQIGYDKAAGEYREALTKAKDEAKQFKDQLQATKDDAELERTNREKEIAVLRSRATVVAVKLRDTENQLSQYISGAPIETCRSAAQTAIRLFGACAAEYRDVAERASGHLADVELFERSYPTGTVTTITGP
jgi:multidrug efflux pump subunit AcrB